MFAEDTTPIFLAFELEVKFKGQENRGGVHPNEELRSPDHLIY
jgi:hypothetical protein